MMIVRQIYFQKQQSISITYYTNHLLPLQWHQHCQHLTPHALDGNLEEISSLCLKSLWTSPIPPFTAIYVTTIIYYYCEHGRNAIVPAYFSPETKDTTPKRNSHHSSHYHKIMFSSISSLVKSHHRCHTVSKTNMLTLSNATTKQDEAQQRKCFC